VAALCHQCEYVNKQFNQRMRKMEARRGCCRSEDCGEPLVDGYCAYCDGPVKCCTAEDQDCYTLVPSFRMLCRYHFNWRDEQGRKVLCGRCGLKKPCECHFV